MVIEDMEKRFDLVRTEFREGLEKILGFENIFITGKDINISSNKSRIGLSSDKNIIRIVRSGCSMVIFDNYRIEGKLIAEMKANESTAYIPLYKITESYKLYRSREIYKASKLLKYLNRKRIDIGFVTFAESVEGMCSYIQMVELAKLIGADEKMAKMGISKINGKLNRCIGADLLH